MSRRLSPVSLALILGAALQGSCLQKTTGPEGEVPPPAPIPTLPDDTTQCAADSDACFELCGSPECGLADGTLPPVLQVPAIFYQPGGATNNIGAPTAAKKTADPCDAVNAASLQIRQRSCGACHGPNGLPTTHFLYALDDTTLANHPDNTGTHIMVKPGDPYNSYVYQRVVTGLQAGSGGMPPDPSAVSDVLGASIVQANPNIVVYPTASDVSVLYAWILNCMPGANVGAYQANYGSGSFGSNPTSGAAAAN